MVYKTIIQKIKIHSIVQVRTKIERQYWIWQEKAQNMLQEHVTLLVEQDSLYPNNLISLTNISLVFPHRIQFRRTITYCQLIILDRLSCYMWLKNFVNLWQYPIISG